MGLFRALFQRLRASLPAASSVEDPVLGTLIQDGRRFWNGELRDGEAVVEVSIFGGRDGPAPQALELCRRIALGLEEFKQRVAQYLRAEAHRPAWRDYARELARQRVSALSIGSKRGLTEGWVFLKGSAREGDLSDDEYSDRLWRCWHSSGQLSGLAFDS